MSRTHIDHRERDRDLAGRAHLVEAAAILPVAANNHRYTPELREQITGALIQEAPTSLV
jgi:hypothetical protein